MGTIGCVGVGVAAGVEVDKTVGGGSVAMGRAVWVSATSVCTMAMAVFCTFVISVARGLFLQAVSRVRRMIQK